MLFAFKSQTNLIKALSRVSSTTYRELACLALIDSVCYEHLTTLIKNSISISFIRIYDHPVLATFVNFSTSTVRTTELKVCLVIYKSYEMIFITGNNSSTCEGKDVQGIMCLLHNSHNDFLQRCNIWLLGIW